MKLGLHSAILSESTFEEVVDYANSVGYKALEIVCWPPGKANRRYAGVTHIDVTDLDESKIAYIKDYCQNKNIQIAALGYYPNPLDPDIQGRNIVIEHLKIVIKAAAELGVNKVSTFIGKDKNKTVEENMILFETIWRPIIALAEAEKVWIGIENCPMYFTDDEWPGGLNLASSPAIWKEMFKIFDSDYFGLSYDPSHLYLQRMDYIAPLYKFKDKIKHIHLKDIKLYREKIDEFGIFTAPLNYMSPKIPGLGGIDWGAFASALYDISYKGAACVEVEDKAFEASSDDVTNAIQLSYSHLQQFI